MRPFMDEQFLLETDTAQQLYHNHAAKMPIIDYHCHINPAQIMENRRFDNITQVWLGGDHYKWRLIRANGVDERYVTGDASDREKFQKFAETLPRCIGNPVYHWAHLELKRYFGCDLVIGEDTAQEIWDLTSQRLQENDMRVRGIIARSHVQAIATTDDPSEDLSWHKKLAADKSNPVTVVPTMRPDKVVNIDSPDFGAYIRKMAHVCGMEINSIDALKTALQSRIAFFDEMGCRASDHGLDYVTFCQADASNVETIFQKGLAGQAVTVPEAEAYKTELMLFFGRELAARGWVMQLHYGALRNANNRMFKVLGPDTGYDAVSTRDCANNIARFLSALDEEGNLPKTILYSLNPNDNTLLDTIIGCFQDGSVVGKMQHGSAWWFNDTKLGIEAQLFSLANVGIMGNFIGMLTDSRSFLSYTRHEYFRRILCNVIGNLVEKGEYPNDMAVLGAMVEDISYRNTARYFGFDLIA